MQYKVDQAILFTAFINDMNKGMECTYRKTVGSKKLETDWILWKEQSLFN